MNVKQALTVWYGGLAVAGLSAGHALTADGLDRWLAGVTAIVVVVGLITAILSDWIRPYRKQFLWGAFGPPAIVVLGMGLWLIGREVVGPSDGLEPGRTETASTYSNQDPTLTGFDIAKRAEKQVPTDSLSLVEVQFGAIDTTEPCTIPEPADCITVSVTAQNRLSQPIDSFVFSLSLRDSLGNTLAEPAPGELELLIAPGEEQSGSLLFRMPYMEDPNRIYEPSLIGAYYRVVR